MAQNPYWLAMAVAISVLLHAAPSPAQIARSGSGNNGSNPQLVQQLQQLASERTSLRTENEKLKKNVDALSKELEAIKGAQKNGDAKAKESAAALARSNAERSAVDEQLKQTKDKMEQLIAKFRETAQSLREIEADRTVTKQTLATRDRDLKSCVDHNDALRKINEEVLARLEHHSLWSRVAENEPFTRIKRTEMENLIDDYAARADDQRVVPQVTPRP